jgi:GNAT superfamily N-acetyltransferase
VSTAEVYEIIEDSVWRAGDGELMDLLRRVYVGGSFTDPEVAATVFTPEAIRARGRLFCARARGGLLIGTVIVVPPESGERRLASLSEAEMHLLAVDSEWRGQGIGQALVRVAVDWAQRAGYSGMVLWTQPTMDMARRVYEQNGFLSLLVVAKESRRRGVGRALLERSMAICTTAKLFTSTNESNMPMRLLLRDERFEESGVIHNLDEGDPELVFFRRVRE